jgi:hypothetical protein
MENRIKEQQLYLFADRASSATMRANQLRLWFLRLSVRRVVFSMAEGYPNQDLFARVLENLQRAYRLQC